MEYADRKLRPRGMRSSFLNEQWRMTPTLCAVVSAHSYNGALIAAPEAPPPGLPPAFPDSIVVVDPAARRGGGSSRAEWRGVTEALR